MGTLLYLSASQMTKDIDAAVARIQDGIDIIMQEVTPTFENTLEALSLLFAREQTIITFMQHVASDKDVRDASLEAHQKITTLHDEVFSNKELYVRIENIPVKDPSQQRLKNEYILRFEYHGGVSHDCANFIDEIGDLEASFEDNIHNDKISIDLTLAELDGMPADYLERNKIAEGHYRIILSPVEVYPIYAHCNNKETRGKIKYIYEHSCEVNAPILQQLLAKRNLLAKCLGHSSWSDYITQVSMSKHSHHVISVLDEIIKHLHQVADRYMQSLQEIADDELTMEDIIYYGNQYMEKHYHLDTEEIREYFPLTHVFDTMLDIYGSLFNLHFQHETEDSSIWHPDVFGYSIYDTASNDLMGTLYCDMFPREGKFEHAAVFNIRDGYRDGDTQVLPIAALVCNIAPPSIDGDSLLTIEEVYTLFHEFGHALHSICAGYRAKYVEFGFAHVSTDFIETPSQLIELWLRNPGVLRRISSHHITGESLPDIIIDRIIASYTCNKSAYEWIRTSAMAVFDHEMYLRHQEDVLEDYFVDVLSTCCPLPPHYGSYIYRWDHLASDMYAGRYYAYVWSMVLACNLYARFEEAPDIMDPTLGYEYRKKILEAGNSKDATELVASFIKSNDITNIKNFLRLNGGCDN